MGGIYIKLPSDIVFEEGREHGLAPYVSLICRKLRKKKSLQQISQELEEYLSRIHSKWHCQFI